MVEDINRDYKRKETVSKCDIEKILQIAKTIKYGSITLVIQDGVLIQIETSEKIRLK
ncbi:YezD family protein [Clostridium akagii]|uniref:YezD family protein n=1 Tax=Clostridium akagii TaxID=91623 RepID=UPI000A01AC35|nr:YezD family protein [Clostridium akagii]